MGSHGVVYNGAAYRTLDDAPPEGLEDGAPNWGCQGTSNYLPLPAGYVLAPNDADSRAVVLAHRWSTSAVVLADGDSWWTSDGYSSGYSGLLNSGNLVTDGATHTVNHCYQRVLARCP